MSINKPSHSRQSFPPSNYDVINQIDTFFQAPETQQSHVALANIDDTEPPAGKKQRFNDFVGFLDTDLRSSTPVPVIHISSCKLLTVLIDPKLTDINVNIFLNNEIQLAKNLELSDFGIAGIASVSKNYNKKLLIVKVKESTNTI